MKFSLKVFDNCNIEKCLSKIFDNGGSRGLRVVTKGANIFLRSVDLFLCLSRSLRGIWFALPILSLTLDLG